MKFTKKLVPQNERKIFSVTIKPYFIYSCINLIFMFLSSKGIGILNDDTFGGLFISWITFSLVLYFTIIKYESESEE